MVYPRVCGGTLECHQLTLQSKGLSPRVRGNLGQPDDERVSVGSIPACAGEPDVVWRADHANEVYPRVCGGTPGVGLGLAGKTGLSPRVRGNPFAAAPECLADRSIPACAGEPA